MDESSAVFSFKFMLISFRKSSSKYIIQHLIVVVLYLGNRSIIQVKLIMLFLCIVQFWIHFISLKEFLKSKVALTFHNPISYRGREVRRAGKTACGANVLFPPI
jgi:hypothetical protein